MKLVFLTLLLLVDGWICGFISYKIRTHSWAGPTIFISTAISSLLWMWMAKDDSKSLAFMSVLFDVTYAAGYFMIILFLGERMTKLSVLGAILALSGVFLMEMAEPS